MREGSTKFINREILKISVDDASDSENELDCTNYACAFTTPNKFDILKNMINDKISVTQDDANVKISCIPCNRAHKCFECMDECRDHCEDAICPGLITMNCHVCRKSFTNQDWAKSNNRL